MNATGPRLNFDATPGLGPEKGHTYSICTPPHAVRTAEAYLRLAERLEKGDRVRIVIGTGHGACTCQGAAFEYISLVHNDLVDRGVRDRVELRWVSNEPCPGDFGIDGFEVQGMCIASIKNSWLSGSAAVIGIHPIVRNRQPYPEHGRNTADSAVEMGLAGAWLKKGLHYGCLYKLAAEPLWWHLP